MVAFVSRWPLFRGGRQLRFDCILNHPLPSPSFYQNIFKKLFFKLDCGQFFALNKGNFLAKYSFLAMMITSHIDVQRRKLRCVGGGTQEPPPPGELIKNSSSPPFYIIYFPRPPTYIFWKNFGNPPTIFKPSFL